MKSNVRHKNLIMAFLVLSVLMCAGTVLFITGDDADASETMVVTDAETLTSAFGSAASGDTILFSSAVEKTEVGGIPAGVTISSSTVGNNQGIIVMIQKTSEGKTYVGSYTTLAAVASVLSANGLDEVKLICSENSYMVANGNHTALVCKELVVDGNGSTLVKSTTEKNAEVTFSIQSEKFTNDVTMTFNDLKNLKVWGQRISKTDLTVNINNCDSSSEDEVGNSGLVMLNAGTYESSAKTTLNIRGCDLKYNHVGTGKVAVYVSTATNVDIEECTFNGVPIALNINPKSTAYGSEIMIKDCDFLNCGNLTDGLEFYGSTIRLSNAKDSGTTTKVMIDKCSFSNNSQNPTVNGDILIGDGRSDKITIDMDVTITNTAAEVQFQKPGYFLKDSPYKVDDKSKLMIKTIDEEETLKAVGWVISISNPGSGSAQISGEDLQEIEMDMGENSILIEVDGTATNASVTIDTVTTTSVYSLVVYDLVINVKNGNESVDYSAQITLSVDNPYNLPLVVKSYDSNWKYIEDHIVTSYDSESVTFLTNHNTYFTIGLPEDNEEEEESGIIGPGSTTPSKPSSANDDSDNTVVIAAVAAVLVIIAACAMMIMKKD